MTSIDQLTKISAAQLAELLALASPLPVLVTSAGGPLSALDGDLVAAASKGAVAEFRVKNSALAGTRFWNLRINGADAAGAAYATFAPVDVVAIGANGTTSSPIGFSTANLAAVIRVEIGPASGAVTARLIRGFYAEVGGGAVRLGFFSGYTTVEGITSVGVCDSLGGAAIADGSTVAAIVRSF